MFRYLVAAAVILTALFQPLDASAKRSKKKESTLGMLKCIGLVIDCGAPHNTGKAKKHAKCVKKMKKVDKQCAKIATRINKCVKKQKCSRKKKGPKGQSCRLGCNFKAVAISELKRTKKCIKKCGQDVKCGAKCTFAIK